MFRYEGRREERQQGGSLFNTKYANGSDCGILSTAEQGYKELQSNLTLCELDHRMLIKYLRCLVLIDYVANVFVTSLLSILKKEHTRSPSIAD